MIVYFFSLVLIFINFLISSFILNNYFNLLKNNNNKIYEKEFKEFNFKNNDWRFHKHLNYLFYLFIIY